MILYNLGKIELARTKNMRINGKITTWNDDKGFGFITPSVGGKQVFVHIKSFDNRNQRPDLNDSVTYTVSTDGNGRPCAINVNLKGQRLVGRRKNSNDLLFFIMPVLFLLIVGVFVLLDNIPPIVLAFYIACSLLAFTIYLGDKLAAQKGGWRTPESTLHLVSLVGGWPGALVAQRIFRHKSNKQSFLNIFWVTVFFNCGVFIWMLTPQGSIVLGTLIEF